MTLRYYLSIPYILAVEALEKNGKWIRRVEYPEIPRCFIEDETQTKSTADLLDELERLLILRILSLLKNGEAVPVPRPPLMNFDAVFVLKRLGQDDLIGLLDVETNKL